MSKNATPFRLHLTAFLSLFVSIISLGQEAEEVTFEHEGLTVFGTFLKPAGEGPFETLIIGPGSGANDRDGTLTLTGPNAECLYPDLEGNTLTPYKDLAEALADSGFAVLRYDKLEYTYTTELEPITFTKLWLPINSAIDYLQSRDDVDPNTITLIGHSESSYLIPYIAENRDDVYRMISIAGARTPFDTLLTDQIVNFAEICDGDVAAANQQATQILAYYDLVRNDIITPSTPPLFGVSASVWSDYLDVIDSVAINYNLANLPTLFLGFELDYNVPPAELDRWENEISIATADFWSLPEINHYMTPMDNPNVAQAVSDTIVYWLRQNPLSVSGPVREKLDLKAYPNPFENDLVIELKEAQSGIFNIRIMDAAGREVYAERKNLSGHRVRLEDLDQVAPGIYHVEIFNEEKRAVVKVVKR